MEAAEAILAAAQERCTTLHVQNAVSRPRFPSSRTDPDQYIAAIVTRSIGQPGQTGHPEDIKPI
jgi:hypothetical protein